VYGNGQVARRKLRMKMLMMMARIARSQKPQQDFATTT
jgi:hypothetical protein